jgi:hypothetical protein
LEAQILLGAEIVILNLSSRFANFNFYLNAFYGVFFTCILPQWLPMLEQQGSATS